MDFNFFNKKIARNHKTILSGLQSAVGAKTLNESIELIEETLIMSDMGIESSGFIAGQLRDSLASGTEALEAKLNKILLDILKPVEAVLNPEGSPFVIMVIGVNGVGKTTTIGKLAGRFASVGKSVILGAGDTFRAGATEQLAVWAKRTGADIVTGAPGSDPSSVAFDTVKAAIARGRDVAIIDTAGRLHSDENLLEELKKVDRVIGKAFKESGMEGSAPHERLLVIDGTTGQNALIQAKSFNEAVDLTGIAITKLDGSAKGGILIPIARELSTAIRYIGVGEKVEDLQDFRALDYVEALTQVDMPVDNC